ncbi:glutamine synthetase family protein [Tianweitania sediminis]|uniref:Glutamine synthetase n=1 Tax=Tianweitania sediminis TaxID=1502156 RepID=A0A8J7R6D0_9HYPH|nr:glutamine synthetase family protein [Tianweitania sediminis]MBP0438702.1 glutamine synthetase [Tianweitania sediminis]
MTDRFDSKIRNGFLARSELLDEEAIRKAVALLSGLEKQGIETVRVLFPDQHGVLRGKTIVASALASTFASGMAAPSTLLLKDTSNRTVFSVWSGQDSGSWVPMGGAGDILLCPDPDTFRVLPWSPHSAWILCDTYTKDGAPIGFAPRNILRKAVAQLANHDLALVVGLEVEFHVYETTDARMEHASATMPNQPPVTRPVSLGYQFLAEVRYDRLEWIMDELRRHAEQLNLPVRSTEVEMGPSQFEFTFDPADPLTHADNMMMFRTMVKEVCARRGLHATFMCRPKVENGAASGWHLHQSLVRPATGQNLFVPEQADQPTELAGQWIAGLLAHARESCLLTTPTVNGYKRYQPFQLAPDRIQWGQDNRGAMIRALMKPGDQASRIENRVAETAANPYYFFATQILSGLDGICSQMTPPRAVETPYNSDAAALPKSMIAAVEAFESSPFYRRELGDEFVNYITHIKRSEWDRYLMTVTEWEQAEYFSLF